MFCEWFVWHTDTLLICIVLFSLDMLVLYINVSKNERVYVTYKSFSERSVWFRLLRFTKNKTVKFFEIGLSEKHLSIVSIVSSGTITPVL